MLHRNHLLKKNMGEVSMARSRHEGEFLLLNQNFLSFYLNHNNIFANFIFFRYINKNV